MHAWAAIPWIVYTWFQQSNFPHIRKTTLNSPCCFCLHRHPSHLSLWVQILVKSYILVIHVAACGFSDRDWQSSGGVHYRNNRSNVGQDNSFNIVSHTELCNRTHSPPKRYQTDRYGDKNKIISDSVDEHCASSLVAVNQSDFLVSC